MICSNSFSLVIICPSEGKNKLNSQVLTASYVRLILFVRTNLNWCGPGGGLSLEILRANYGKVQAIFCIAELNWTRRFYNRDSSGRCGMQYAKCLPFARVLIQRSFEYILLNIRILFVLQQSSNGPQNRKYPMKMEVIFLCQNPSCIECRRKTSFELINKWLSPY